MEIILNDAEVLLFIFFVHVLLIVYGFFSIWNGYYSRYEKIPKSVIQHVQIEKSFVNRCEFNEYVDIVHSLSRRIRKIESKTYPLPIEPNSVVKKKSLLKIEPNRILSITNASINNKENTIPSPSNPNAVDFKDQMVDVSKKRNLITSDALKSVQLKKNDKNRKPESIKKRLRSFDQKPISANKKKIRSSSSSGLITAESLIITKEQLKQVRPKKRKANHISKTPKRPLTSREAFVEALSNKFKNVFTPSPSSMKQSEKKLSL